MLRLCLSKLSTFIKSIKSVRGGVRRKLIDWHIGWRNVMEVIDKYLEYKMRMDILKADLNFINAQMNSVRVSGGGEEGGAGGSKGNKIDKLLDDKVRLEGELENRVAFMDHVEVVLKVLEEKYKGVKYQVFEMRYIEKKPLRCIAEEVCYSYVHVDRVSKKIMTDFATMTSILM